MVSCRGGGESTPTPFPEGGTETAVSPSANNPLPVSLSDLAANPTQYEGQYLQVTGRYQRAPLLICSSEPYLSPATWKLAENSILISAGGFDEPMRSLLPDDLTITVKGQWQRWQGPVGCGKRAVPTEIWYLAVNQIISPSMLTQVTLTPPLDDSQLVGSGILSGTTPLAATPTDFNTLPPVPGSPQPTVESTEFSPTSEIAPTQAISATPTLPLPGGTLPAYPVSTNTPGGVEITNTPPLGTPASGETPDENLTPTSTETSGTIVPGTTVAATPGAPPTATAVSGTPGTINTPPGSTVVTKEEIGPEELATEPLGANEIHSWPYNVISATFITVSVAAPDNIDMAIAIANASGAILTQQNIALAGQVEVLVAYNLPAAGSYQVRVWASNGAATSYSLLVTETGSYNFLFAGILSYGETQTINMNAESDHFWHFYGTVGEKVTITAVPQDQGDLFMELYGGPDTENLSGFVDNGSSGEEEQIAIFTLPVTGIYVIRVGEFDFQPTSYQISLVQN